MYMTFARSRLTSGTTQCDHWANFVYPPFPYRISKLTFISTWSNIHPASFGARNRAPCPADNGSCGVIADYLAIECIIFGRRVSFMVSSARNQFQWRLRNRCAVNGSAEEALVSGSRKKQLSAGDKRPVLQRCRLQCTQRVALLVPRVLWTLLPTSEPVPVLWSAYALQWTPNARRESLLPARSYPHFPLPEQYKNRLRRATRSAKAACVMSSSVLEAVKRQNRVTSG